MGFCSPLFRMEWSISSSIRSSILYEQTRLAFFCDLCDIWKYVHMIRRVHIQDILHEEYTSQHCNKIACRSMNPSNLISSLAEDDEKKIEKKGYSSKSEEGRWKVRSPSWLLSVQKNVCEMRPVCSLLFYYSIVDGI